MSERSPSTSSNKAHVAACKVAFVVRPSLLAPYACRKKVVAPRAVCLRVAISCARGAGHAEVCRKLRGALLCTPAGGGALMGSGLGYRWGALREHGAEAPRPSMQNV